MNLYSNFQKVGLICEINNNKGFIGDYKKGYN